MPYPADSSRPPKQILMDLPAFGGTPNFAWQPDNRHLIVSTAPRPGVNMQLRMADILSGEHSVLSAGTTNQAIWSASPDGTKLVFSESNTDYDIASLDLATAKPERLLASQRSDVMPSWAAHQPVLAFISDRNGEPEIWLRRQGEGDRQLVGSRTGQ